MTNELETRVATLMILVATISFVSACSSGAKTAVSQQSTATSDGSSQSSSTASSSDASPASICARIDPKAIAAKAGAHGSVAFQGGGTGDGAACFYNTSDRQIMISETAVDPAHAQSMKTALFASCAPLSGVGIFAVDCSDGRGVQVYLDHNALMTFLVTDLPVNDSNASVEHDQTVAVARYAAPLMS